MTSPWPPYREPLRATLLRTGAIAMVVGLLLAAFRGGFARWPMATLLVLWPSFGGHWVEIFFLNWLRPRLPSTRSVQVGARIGVWFVGGVGLAIGMGLTATALGAYRATRWPADWHQAILGGFAFIGVELIAHVALQWRGVASFYNGRG
jgi:hypothetical protein